MEDLINHPSHYEKHKITIQPLDLIDTMNFCVGNVIKYVIRAQDKGNELLDLQKARFYHKRSWLYFDDSCIRMIFQLAVLFYSDNDLLSELGRQIKTGFGPRDAWMKFGIAINQRIEEIGGNLD